MKITASVAGLLLLCLTLTACQTAGLKRVPNLTDRYALTKVEVVIPDNIDKGKSGYVSDRQQELRDNTRRTARLRLEEKLTSSIVPLFTGNRPAAMYVRLKTVETDTHKLRLIRGHVDELRGQVDLVNSVDNTLVSQKAVAAVGGPKASSSLIGAVGNAVSRTIETTTKAPIEVLTYSFVEQVKEWISKEKRKNHYRLQPS